MSDYKEGMNPWDESYPNFRIDNLNAEMGAEVSNDRASYGPILDFTHYHQPDPWAVIQHEWTRPSILLRPRVEHAPGGYRAELTDGQAPGCVGYGLSREAAMRDFDVKWREKIDVCY